MHNTTKSINRTMLNPIIIPAALRNFSTMWPSFSLLEMMYATPKMITIASSIQPKGGTSGTMSIGLTV